MIHDRREIVLDRKSPYEGARDIGVRDDLGFADSKTFVRKRNFSSLRIDWEGAGFCW